MKKVILIPDSFKGTMSSAEICTVMAQAVQEYYPDAQVHSVPVADGGEGSVDSFLQAVGGEKVSVPVKGPYFEEVPAFYGMLPDGVAVIEMAAAAGLPLVGERLHAEQTTTYGVGELMPMRWSAAANGWWWGWEAAPQTTEAAALRQRWVQCSATRQARPLCLWGQRWRRLRRSTFPACIPHLRARSW